MDWPALAINIVTFNRKEILRGTLGRLSRHLWYEGPRHVIVADDGSTDGTQEMLRREFPDVTLVESKRAGLGANTNAGLRACFKRAELVLQLQDDMHLLGTLDLHPHVERLLTDPTAGFIRLWGVGGHRYHAQLEEGYWRIWWTSPDLYIPSDRPHLKHRRWHDFYGYYPQGLPTAATEDAWCHQCKDKAAWGLRRLDVLVPLSVDLEKSWEHMEWGNRWRDKGL